MKRKIFTCLIITGLLLFLTAGMVSAQFANNWKLDIDGAGSLQPVVIDELLDIVGSGYIINTFSDGTGTFIDYGVFVSRAYDQGFLFPWADTYELTAKLLLSGNVVLGGPLTFTSGTVDIYADDGSGLPFSDDSDQSDGVIYGADDGTLIASFVVQSGTGSVNTTGVPNGQITIILEATFLKPGYWFDGSGRDLSTLTPQSIVLGFSTTNASFVGYPTDAVIKEIAEEFAGVSIPETRPFSQPPSDLFLGTNGQLRLIVPECSGSIGDFVWHDLDRDGIQDGGEPGIDDVTVNLYDASNNTLVATTTTGPNGFYQFLGLCAGDYTVEVDETTLPPNFVPSPCDAGMDDTVDNDCSPKDVNLPDDNTNDPTNDFGYNTPCNGSIGDFVWHDQDRDGIQDAGEPGLDGITVILKDAMGTQIATTTTGPNGFYQFLGLCAGDYTVEVDETTLPPNFVPSPCNAGMDDTVDNDCSPVSVTLPDDNTNDPTIDFGYNSPCSGSIGDFVWQDLNRDGIQDTGEPGIDDVTVNLYDASNNTLLATTTTGPNGFYEFTGLCAGDYTVEVDETTLPPGFEPSPCNAGMDDTVDNDCSPAQVTLPDDNTNDLTIDFGYNTPSCTLQVTKSCFIIPPPVSDFECVKPIDALTMIWNGTQEPIRIKAWKGNVGSTLLSDIDNINIDDEVTVSGYAGSPNDVIWEIFQAGTDHKIGESIFHVSCSDPDMNGPEDCGKPQGDGKDKSGFINDWVLEGMVAKSSSFDCNSTPSPSTSECEILAPPPPPHCLGKVKVLVLRYLGGGCEQTTNYQDGKVLCSGDAGENEPIKVVITRDTDKVMVTPSDESLYRGDVFTITTTENELRADTEFDIMQGSTVLQSLKIHTSCSQELNLGDRFGSVEVVGLNTTEGGLASLGAEVEYSYLIENTGVVDVFDVTVQDDKLGKVTEIPIDSLGPGESVTLTTTTFVDSEVTNIVTATGKTAGGAECSANDSATVTVVPRPPTECIVSGDTQLNIGDNKIEWKLFNNGSETITIDSISLNWPADLGNLRKIKLDGDTIFEQDVLPPAATVNTFINDLNKRQIKPNDDRKLVCEFRNKAKTTQFDFSIVVNFVEGCSVEFVPGLAPFECTKPIDAITMIWEGSAPIRIKAWKGNVGSTLLSDIDDIMFGEEVSVSGYAGSPNDVIWEIFQAGTDNKVGESIFHLSCSDPDMNGPEDCGKFEGDGKDNKSGFINDWSLEGMIDSISILDCTP